MTIDMLFALLNILQDALVLSGRRLSTDYDTRMLREEVIEASFRRLHDIVWQLKEETKEEEVAL